MSACARSRRRSVPKLAPSCVGLFRRRPVAARSEPRRATQPARTHAPAERPSRSFTHADRPFVVRDLTLVPAKRGETRAHAPAAAAAAVHPSWSSGSSVSPAPPRRHDAQGAAVEAPVKREVKKAKKAATPKRSAGKPSGGSGGKRDVGGDDIIKLSDSDGADSDQQGVDRRAVPVDVARKAAKKMKSKMKTNVHGAFGREKDDRPRVLYIGHVPFASFDDQMRALWAVRRRTGRLLYRGTRRRANPSTRCASSSIPKSPRSSPRAWTTTCSSRAC